MTGTGRHTVLQTGECCSAVASRSSSSASEQMEPEAPLLAATGSTPIAYAQNLRIEEAKRLVEESETPIDEIAAAIGYENAAFFRRLTGLPPGDYRRMFQRMPAPR